MPDDRIIIGFDFGIKYIGVAVGQTLTRSAQALTTLIAQGGVPNWDEITQLVESWRPQSFVVGLPLNMDGTEQPLTQTTKHFAAQLQARYHLPVYFMDERLSSVEARAELFAAGGYKKLRKKAIDSMAAQLILESWLLNQ